MSRYIDADKLLKTINENVAEAHNERCAQLLEAILYAPAADVVEVVRCEECEHYNRTSGICLHFGYYTYYPDVDDDDFCSYGRRRKEDGI